MQITIQKLWPASPKYVSFKGTDGKSYKGEPTLNGKLFEGQTIDPPTVRESRYTNNKGEEVASYWLPKTFEPDNNTVGAIIPQATQHGQQPVNGQHDPNPRYAPAPPRPGNGDKSGEMFVMGVVGRAMGSGKFDTQDVKLLAIVAAEAWNEVKGKL